jgi:hypothetical protein
MNMLHLRHRTSVLLFLTAAFLACPNGPKEKQNETADQEIENTDGGPDTNTTEPTAHGDIDAGPVIVGGITGRILNRGRAPLAGLKIMACSSSICRTSDTDANGEYLFTDLIVEPRHVQVYDFSNVYLSVLYYQDVFPNEVNVLSRDVILPDLTTPPRSLPVATGGTVVLADGAFELTVAPNTLEYPMGYDEEVIQAERLAGEEIPPYDIEPWLSQAEHSFAFAFYPHKIKTTESAHFTIKAGITQPEGSKYQIWTAHFTTATLHRVGTATVEATGHLVSDPDSTIKDLTTVLLIPDAPSLQEHADGGLEDSTATDAGAATSPNMRDGGL